jgi:hypothetical protein
MGRPIDRVVRSDIPLVPVPPPPLSRPDENKTARTAADSELEAAKSATPPPSPPARLTTPKPVPISSKTPPAARVVAPTVTALVKSARKVCGNLDSYIVRLTRREQVGDKMDPEQVILFKFRQQPWSVYFKWLGKEGQGREVVYVKGHHQGKIHSKLAAGDMPFMPAGKRLALSPDNALVKSATRHPISQAGITASVERLAAVQAALEKGDRKRGDLVVRAGVNRAEFSKPVDSIEHVMPAGADPTLPKGGTRTYFFHPETGLPMLIRTVDETGKEVEYYRYDLLQTQVKLDDADFDPEVLFARPVPPANRP